MKVSLFLDGKNFYSGWKDRAGSRTIDFSKLSGWLVEQAGGTVFTGAHYYTGVEPDAEASSPLASFLEMLEFQRGFFVHRFPRKRRSTRCDACGAEHQYTTEKEVDTTMVADMLRLAAVGAFDVLVLLSGDADHTPAIEGVRALGKVAYVATWGGSGLSTRLRKAAFDHIDLLGGVALFADGKDVSAAAAGSEFVLPGDTDGAALQVFLDELERSAVRLAPGYVGVNYFLTQWRSERLESTPLVRRRLLDRLVADGKIELYDAPNAELAMRKK